MGKRMVPKVGENDPEIGSRSWRIRNIELDERLLELRVGGAEVRIEPKPLGVLMLLLRNADRVVTTRELSQLVWGGRAVSEQVLAQCVARLRRALGAANEDLVRTIHGWGYRLAEVPEGTKPARMVRKAKELRAGDDHPLRRGWKLVEPVTPDGRAWLTEHRDSGLRRNFLHLRRTAEINHAAQEIALYNGAVAHGKLEGLICYAVEWNFDVSRAPAFVEYPANLVALTTWVQQQGTFAGLPTVQRLRFLADLCDRLDGAHRNGVSFGRLNPAAILVGGSRIGEPMIFLPGAMHRIDALCPRLYCGAWPGHEALFVAPEIRSGSPVTAQSDVYSLGVLMLQMIVGDWSILPLPGWEERLRDEELRSVIRTATHLDHDSRPRDIKRIAQQLRAAMTREWAQGAEGAQHPGSRD